MSLRARLVLSAAYILIVLALVLEIPLAVSIDKRAVGDFESNVLAQAAVVSSRVSDAVGTISAKAKGSTPETPTPTPEIERIVSAYAASAGARVIVVDQVGQVIIDSSGEAPAGTVYATALRPEFLKALSGKIDFYERFSNTLGQHLVVVAVPIWEGGTVVGAVRFSATLGAIGAKVHRAWITLGLVGVVMVGVGIVLAWVLATSIAQPVRRLGAAATRLGRGDLDARAEEGGPGEVATMARSFNRMADALAANITAQRDFVANASHQLRTPLTGLRLRLEALADRGGETAEEAAKAVKDVDRMASLVQGLLILESASATNRGEGATVDLAEQVREAGERWEAQADRAGSALRVAAEPASARTDPKDVAHILDNLLENAIRYAPAGASIVVSSRTVGGAPEIAVADDGPGIPLEERERVFERFYRGSTGRSRGPGTGLGLAIVAEMAHRWGGHVRLAEGAGTHVQVRFPPPSVSLPR